MSIKEEVDKEILKANGINYPESLPYEGEHPDMGLEDKRYVEKQEYTEFEDV